jgi:hypothetical protein
MPSADKPNKPNNKANNAQKNPAKAKGNNGPNRKINGGGKGSPS